MKRNDKFEWETSFIQAKFQGNTGMVGLLVATLDNGKGHGFHVSARSIGRWTGIHPKTAERQLKKLVELGWLERTRTGGRRGNQNFASEYKLRIPEGFYRPKLTAAQPDDEEPQQGGSSPQGDASAPPLDQVSLDQVSLDHPSSDQAPTSLDVASLAPGDEVTTAELRQLGPEQQGMFVPGFDDDVWIYEPELMARVSDAAWEASKVTPSHAPRRRALAPRKDLARDQASDPSLLARYTSRR